MDYQHLSTSETDYPLQSNSEYTVLSFSTAYLSERFDAYYNISIVKGAEIDIQVEALIGTIGPSIPVGSFPEGTEFYGQTSGWSNTQTVTLPANVPLSSTSAPSSSSPPTTTSTSPKNPISIYAILIAVLVVLIVAFVVVIAVFRRGKKHL